MNSGLLIPGKPVVTVAIPSLNQGKYLDSALSSLAEQEVPTEIYVADGGSTDCTGDVIERWKNHLAGWRSHPDAGQAAAINECIRKGSAPFVYWINSDDRLLPGGLDRLVASLRSALAAPAVYGKVWNDANGRRRAIRVEPFDETRLAIHCIVSQPGALVRRSAWGSVGGLREDLQMAMDYDLWWRLYRKAGPLEFVDDFVAVNRDHPGSKTNMNRRLHYREAMAVVRQFYGRVPIKWWAAQPYSVWLRGLWNWWMLRSEQS